MNRITRMTTGHFWLLIGVLAALAVFLYAINRGYGYLGYGLGFLAVLLFIARYAPLWLKILTAVLVGLGFVWFCIAETPVILGARSDARPGTPYLIILGAQVRGDTMSITLQNRTDGALRYLQQYPDTVVICSGGKGDGENISEAQAMHDYLLSRGIPEDHILMEDRSTNTTENLRNSFALIRARGDEPDGNVTIVSSAYHLYRARYIARSLGVRASAFAGEPGYPLVMLNFFIREAFGVTRLWLLGY